MLRIVLAIWLAVPPVAAFAGSMTLLGVGNPTSSATYQGPGDVVSGALIWGSCSRVYNASLANTSTSLCDLVDSSAPTVTICTLRGSAAGTVDLANTYCTGSLTPSAKCAAATGGKCQVSKVYDQIGGTSGWVNTTGSQQPVLTFSALNGLPGLTGTSAANTLLTTSATFTQSMPFTWVAVGERTTNFTTVQALIGASGSYNGAMGFTSTANTVGISGNGTSYQAVGSVADSAFHALIGVMNTGSTCVMYADGNSATGSNCSGAAMSSATSRIMRDSAGHSMDGVWIEGGLWPGGFTGTQQTNMNSNIHTQYSF